MDKVIYVVARVEGDEVNFDSQWDDEESARKRADELSPHGEFKRIIVRDTPVVFMPIVSNGH